MQCLSHWYINYVSNTYLSPLIHIYFTTRLHINERMQEKTSPPHFSSRNLSIYRGFHKGGVRQTGHSTPHLTPPSSYYFHNWTLFEFLTFRNQMKVKNLRRKSDLLREVLSEVFGKHLTLRIPFKQRCFGWKSEVVRSFCKLLIFSQKRKARQTNKIAYLADW